MLLRSVMVLLVLTASLGAAPITFSITGLATGAVDATPFTDAPFVFTLSTDTALITMFANGFRTPQIAGVALHIDGFGDGTFTNTQHVFDNTTNSSAGITDNVAGDLVHGRNPVFGTYHLQAAIGPVLLNDANTAEQFIDIPTSIGLVTFESVTNVTLTAVTTPEPTTLGLTLLGIVGLYVRRQHQRSTKY